MKEIEPTPEMVKAAESLKEGAILLVYRDGGAIRMETADGEDPYVWREDHWKPMGSPRRTLVDGEQIYPGHRELKDNGQQKGYVVLATEEREKGFVRPVRGAYVHDKCGTTTTMNREIAETYARDPHFYSGTFCVFCGGHFPIGEDGQFVWSGTNEKVGT